MNSSAIRIEQECASTFERTYEVRRTLKSSPGAAFEFLDDPRQLFSHMGKSSWMMMGSRMKMSLDSGGGRKVGSVINLDGKMMGLALFVREHVIERSVPVQKVWETIGPQKMLIIDQYRMGFRLLGAGEVTHLTVIIKYNLPRTFWNRALGKVFAGIYARWCTEKMVSDASKHFAHPSDSKVCCH